MRNRYVCIILLNISVLFFTACSNKIPSLNERKDLAYSLINDKNIIQQDINTNQFNLFSFQKISNSCKDSIKVYIEGDGLSWISRNTISSNPTPINPVALKLMLQDNSSCKIYIARPCQYINSNLCEDKYWTSHRFNLKIINAYEEALNIIKNKYSNKTFDLIGYSGGGAIVTIIASIRDDINSVTTIAGNLDIEKWSKIKNISKLNGSLNPIDFTSKIENIKQYHLIGSKDNIIPKDIFFSYKNRFKNQDKIKYFIYETNHNNWENIYKEYLNIGN